jgi:hypothetical protein
MEYDESVNAIEYETDDEDTDVLVQPTASVPVPSTPQTPIPTSIGKKSISGHAGADVSGPVCTPIASDDHIPAGKNPFDSSLVWNLRRFAQVKVDVSNISHNNETTNARTRNNAPEARYWKVTVGYTYGAYSSEIIRLDNISIPYSENQGYGQNYVYACLPVWFKDALVTACQTRRRTIADDASLQSNVEQWWKAVNFRPNSFGTTMVQSGNISSFQPKPLNTIFATTKKGIKTNP